MLFVSSSNSIGRSVSELIDLLEQREHHSLVLRDNGAGHAVTRFLHGQLRGVSARFDGAPMLSGSTSWLRSIPGRRAHRARDANVEVLETVAPENAFDDIALEFAPNLVVGCAIAPETWRAIRSSCIDLHVPVAMVLEDHSGLGHLDALGHDLVFADTPALAELAAPRADRVVAIPPVARETSSHVGGATILAAAPSKPASADVLRAIAMSQPASPVAIITPRGNPAEMRTTLRADLRSQPNIAARPRGPRGIDFDDVGALIIGDADEQWPRLVADAHAAHVPVIAADQPGIAVAVAEGGAIIGDLEPTEWAAEFAQHWTDPAWLRGAERGAAESADAHRAISASRGDALLEMLMELTTTIRL